MVQSESTAGLPPRLWPSLLIAAILATVLPVAWLSLTDPFNHSSSSAQLKQFLAYNHQPW